MRTYKYELSNLYANNYEPVRYGEGNKLLGPSSLVIPFVACGDLTGFDPDKSYPLELGGTDVYTFIPPVQPPINPNYHSYQVRNKKI